MVNGTLAADTSAYYDNSRADGSSGKNLTGLWKDRFSAYLEGEGSKIPLEEPFAMNEHAQGNYTLKFNNLPLGTYNLGLGVSDNINVNEYWTEPKNQITNEFNDDFEDICFSLAVWSPTNGDLYIDLGSKKSKSASKEHADDSFPESNSTANKGFSYVVMGVGVLHKLISGISISPNHSVRETTLFP